MVSVGRGESVPDGRVALQELPLLVVEFAPDPVGVDLEVVQFAGVGGTPDVLEDHPAGADFSGVPGEEGEEVKLSGGEVERSAVKGGLAVYEVEMQGADVKLRRVVFAVVGTV